MANILFVESDPVAVKAFEGIINRSAHSLRTVNNITDAWDSLNQDKFYDLVVLEVRLDGETGEKLISDIRQHPFFSKQPVLVYSKLSDKRSIRKVLVLDVQNFLIKPYSDDKIYAEINKAHDYCWWLEYFDPLHHVCDRLGISDDELKERYSDIVAQLKHLPEDSAEIEDSHLVALLKLHRLLDGVGIPVLQAFLEQLEDAIKKSNTTALQRLLPIIPQAIRVMRERIRPGTHSDASVENEPSILYEDDSSAKDENKGIASVKTVCDWKQMQARIDQMDGYPVIDSVAASFQMAAENPDIEVETLVQMIETDPCLATQVIYYCNAVSSSSKGQEVSINDPKQAIQMFGISRIKAVASSLTTVPEDSLSFKGFGWQDYWTYQMGCAMLSEEIVKMLSLPINENFAFFGGLVHEMGKIIIAYQFPDAFENAMQVANSTAVPLAETESHYFGCTHEQVGEYFAQQSKLPEGIAACCGYFREPEKAPPEHQELVAVVSLADYLCKLFEIGYSGSRLPKNVSSFAGHPSWKILKPILYHGFTVAKFERACKERIQILKRELLGLSEKRYR